MKKGFHILEILYGVGAVSILISLVIFVINPSEQLANTRNAERRSEVQRIMNSIYVYIQQEGKIPETITQEPKEICQIEAQNCNNLIDLSMLAEANIIQFLPVDESTASKNGIGYGLFRNGKWLTITAPGAENGVIIEYTQ